MRENNVCGGVSVCMCVCVCEIKTEISVCVFRD